ncbi:uncharacterized protein LOC131934673 [Physella acuta]|uniref:uncharacterized protein LOC131934673 n=1 Tax=Physella acuta TaxID=109671 RepID=UPI0027DB1B4C|nr:uncharacterized protein LOC131934673 [Physella acuta]
METTLVFILSFALCYHAKAAVLTDPCRLTNVYSNQPDGAEPLMYLVIPPGCKSGQVDWDWPQGAINLSAELPGQNFRLCIEARSTGVSMLGGITELTGGVSKPLALPSAGDPTCTTSVKGQAELLMHAFHSQLYWTTFLYTVVPDTTN